MSDKTVSIGFTNAEFLKLQKLAQTDGVSIPQYIKSQIIPNEFDAKYKELLQKVKKIKPGENFNIKILWEENEWNNISRGVRLSLGRHFYRNVETENIDNVIIKGFGVAGIMCY